jgi:hypothetical protein
MAFVPAKYTYSVRRWIITVSLMTVILAGNVWSIHCAPQSAGIGSDVPDCCRDGLCPHHQDQKASGSCPHTMSSSDSLVFVSGMPAVVSEYSLTTVELARAGSTVELNAPQVVQPALFPSTPPPKL